MSSHILKPGTNIGDSFELQELLGSGGFGITYKAWDTEFERVVSEDISLRIRGSRFDADYLVKGESFLRAG